MKKKNNTYFIDSSLSDYDYLVLDNLSNLNEEHDKTIKEDEKVSDSVYFHGSVEDIEGYLNKPINWITKDFDYAKTFALGNGYVYECSANLGNLLDVGKTDARVFDLLPSNPLKLSREFTAIIRKLNVSEDSIRRIIDNVANEYKVNPYRLAIRPVVRSMAFKRILEGLGFDGVRAIEYDSVNNKDVETFGLFDQVKVLGKVNESLDEEKAITWGDLDVAKKTDTRKMMSGRGTGHFGTGFYFVGKDGPYGLDGEGNFKNYDYEPSRPIYEIDLDKYKLYRPKDNDSAYRLHDAMASINNYYSPDMNKYLFSNIDTDALVNNFYDAVANLDEDVEDDDFDDLDFDIDDIEDTEEDDAEKDSTKDNSKYIDVAKSWIEKYDLADWINTGYDDLDAWLDKNKNKLGLIEKSVEDAINNRDKYLGYVEYAIDVLCKVFNTDRDTLMAMCKAFYNMKSEDTISTLLFKEFGYEGVDVTHLNHDAQGLSGLDNFGYGTVIYDLKPDTFKKIKEPRRGGSIHAKAGESLDEDIQEIDIPQYLYHATYKPFLKSIKEKGLGNTRRKMWSDSKRGVVYLAKDKHVAYSYAETAEWLDDVEDYDKYADNIIVLKIDVNKLDKSKLFDDENVLDDDSTLEYHGIIPFDAVVDVISESLNGDTEDNLIKEMNKELLNFDLTLTLKKELYNDYKCVLQDIKSNIKREVKINKRFNLKTIKDWCEMQREYFDSLKNESLKEDIDLTTTVYTYQSPEVLKQLQNGETYIASYERGMLSNDSYKELARILELNNCPIFGGLSEEDTEDMAESSNIDTYDKVLLKLEVPTSEVHKMGYYDWTDYIYYYIDGQEEPELSREEFENILRKYSDDTPCQVVIDRIESNWLKNKGEQVEKDLNEYFDAIEDSGEKYRNYEVLDNVPIFVTDEVYRIKNMLENDNTPYRILRMHKSNSYLIQNALGNKAHYDMAMKAEDEGYISLEDDYFDDEDYVVFIPADFSGKLRWHTSLGSDNYDECRVYPFGVMFVRDSTAFNNSLFRALGEPEKELHYNEIEEKVTILKGGTKKVMDVYGDLNGEPNNALTQHVEN